MAKLTADAKRVRTIIIATPFLVASSILLYQRLVLGKEQRKIPVMKKPDTQREELEALLKRTAAK